MAATDALLALHLGHEPDLMSSMQMGRLHISIVMRTSGEHCTSWNSLVTQVSVHIIF